MIRSGVAYIYHCVHTGAGGHVSLLSRRALEEQQALHVSMKWLEIEADQSTPSTVENNKAWG
jgi:hypothetical protein